jgi:DNA-binding CsgD family transcriptional regulator
MHTFVLHFTIRYTGLIKKIPIYPFYIPSFCFLFISLSDNLVFVDIYRSEKFWEMVPDYQSVAFYLLIANYLSYYLLSIALLYVSIKKTEFIRIRKQSRLILIAIIITITSYNIEPFLGPLFFNYHTYGQAPLYSIVWISIIWYAIVKYRFLGAHKKTLTMEVFNSLHEMVIITDKNKTIININRTLRDRLGRPEGIFSLQEIFLEHELLQRLIDSIGNKPVLDINLNLVISQCSIVPVKASLSIFQDRFQDDLGFIITAQEITDNYHLLRKNMVTKRENQLIQLILAGNSNRQIAETMGISLRTVETHITHIFDKLGLKNRIELINYCNESPSAPADF